MIESQMGLKENDSKKVNMLLTLVLWCILCTVSMTAMLVVAADKTIVVADTTADQSESITEKVHGSTDREQILELQADSSGKNQLCIPLEKGTKAEQVTVENRYAEQELWIYIKDAEEEFYRQNAVSGDISTFRECRCVAKEEGLLIKLRTNTVWEYYSTIEDSGLKITFSDPREIFTQIVVLDPVGLPDSMETVDLETLAKTLDSVDTSEDGRASGMLTGSRTEQDVALQVARLVQKKVSQTDIKIYLTRTEETAMSLEKRLRLVEAVKPDLFLQIGVSQSPENPEQYGILAYYNDEYYIPDFGNVEWADTVTKKVTVAASDRALGLFPAEEDSILRKLQVPAAGICLGYCTNAQENALLAQESYQEKLAEGIAEAILEVYTNTYLNK